MKLAVVVGVLLIVAGVAALAVRGFEYTKDSHEVGLGPISFEIEEKEQVEIPTWAGVVAVAAGTGLLLVGRKR